MHDSSYIVNTYQQGDNSIKHLNPLHHCCHFNMIFRCQVIVLHYTTKPSRKEEAKVENRARIEKHDPPYSDNRILHYRDNSADINGIDHWLLIRNHIQTLQGFL